MLPLITWLCVAGGFVGHVQGQQASSVFLLTVMTEAALAV